MSLDEAFIRELVSQGTCMLPCGGAIISEPRRAIFNLQQKYGNGALRQKCLALVTRRAELPEGVECVAKGIVYHLADEAFLDTLLASNQEGSLDPLIAAVCSKLNQLLPAGVKPQDECNALGDYWDESEQVTNVHAAIILLVLIAGMAAVLLAGVALVNHIACGSTP
jgi:hypothetical protein